MVARNRMGKSGGFASGGSGSNTLVTEAQSFDHALDIIANDPGYKQKRRHRSKPATSRPVKMPTFSWSKDS